MVNTVSIRAARESRSGAQVALFSLVRRRDLTDPFAASATDRDRDSGGVTRFGSQDASRPVAYQECDDAEDESGPVDRRYGSRRLSFSSLRDYDECALITGQMRTLVVHLW